MSDARSLPRWKRVFLCVSLLICLFTVNCSLFTVRARANVSEGNDSSEYMLGIPFDITFTVPPTEYLGNTDILRGSLLDVTKFYANDDGTVSVDSGSAVTWNRTSDGFPVLLWNILNVSSSTSLDLRYINALRCSVYSFSSEEDFIVDVDDSYSDGFNPGFTVSDTVGKSFAFDVFFPIYDDTLSIVGIGSRILNIPTFDSTGWHFLLPFDRLKEVYNSNNLPYFLGNDGKRYLWIDSWTCSFDSASRYFPQYTFTSSQLYSSVNYSSFGYYNLLSDRMKAIIDDNVSMSVSFDDISWTDWIVNSVGAFMDFQIVPNFSIGGLMALLIGMSLFMIFLKVFAGG